MSEFTSEPTTPSEFTSEPSTPSEPTTPAEATSEPTTPSEPDPTAAATEARAQATPMTDTAPVQTATPAATASPWTPPEQVAPRQRAPIPEAATMSEAELDYTADEMMTVAAARALADGAVCFVGIGLPSTAANLARRLHAPNLVLIYESGTLDTRPDLLPLSIGDGILADSALTVVSVPEVFNYWLQSGRIDVGFLSGAQLDRFGNINTTVIGEYDEPSVRLPGSGGAPEIAASCGEVIIVMRHRQRAFVETVDFVTSVGNGSGPDDRKRLGLTGAGPKRVITDLGILEPDPDTRELTLTGLHPGVTVERVRAETGWPLALHAERLVETPAPTAGELAMLRSLRTVGQ